jgi:hypothetical protein
MNQINASGILPNSWTSEVTLDDWRLIQDCVVDKISELKHRQSWGHEDVVYQLEMVLNKIRTKGLSVYL